MVAPFRMNGGQFATNPDYFEHATDFERRELREMQAEIETRAAELRDLRQRRQALALLVQGRGRGRRRLAVEKEARDREQDPLRDPRRGA